MTKKIVSGSTTITEDPNTGEKIITCKDPISGVENTTIINKKTHEVTSEQTLPSNSTFTSSSVTTSSTHDLTTKHNGQVIAHEHSETPPTTVSGDTTQPTDHQG